jgi:hypothetical protein
LAYRLLGIRLGSWLLAFFPLASCYTSPVNMRPEVEIKRPATRIYRGDPWTYSATVSDPDNDPTVLQWATTEASCPDNARSPEAWPSTWLSGPDLVVREPLTTKSFCVWAKATDKYGAAAVDTYSEAPLNHPPEAAIKVLMPSVGPLAPASAFVASTYPVHTTFMLSATTTDVDAADVLTFEWKLEKGGVPVPDASLGCAGSTDSTLACFTADEAGDYLVEVSVRDGMDTAVAKLPLAVRPGHAPVAVLDHDPEGEGPFRLATRFRLSAKNSTDEDPWDAGRLRPMWDFTNPGGTADGFGPCADDPSEAVRCFTGDAPGVYHVTLTVLDDANLSSVRRFDPMVLGDALPCLGTTDPERSTPIVYPKPKEAKMFIVGDVDDDLDIFPNPDSIDDVAKFDWFLSESWTGSNFVIQTGNGSVNHFTLGADAYPLGTELRVRVQIRDRDTMRSDLAFERCGDADKCFSGSEADRCYQRWTWKVKYGE